MYLVLSHDETGDGTLVRKLADDITLVPMVSGPIDYVYEIARQMNEPRLAVGTMDLANITVGTMHDEPAPVPARRAWGGGNAEG